MRRSTIIGFLAGLIALLASALWIANTVTWPRTPLPPRTGIAMADVKSWGYQLQRVQPSLMPPSLDLLVVDYARDGGETSALSTADIARLRRRPDGSSRIVLAYMSVGEAENYRFYWRRHWAITPPSWLGAENPEWKGNFRVRYWDPGWQRVFVDPQRTLLDLLIGTFDGTRKPYLDRIIEAGFDGVYLDRVDAFYDRAKEFPAAEDEMVALVGRLSAYAKQRRPGFLIVPQNGEELLQHAAYRRTIDAVAKEDLVLGIAGTEQENTKEDIDRSIELLNHAKTDRLPVLVVEYAQAPAKQALVRARLDRLGYVLHYARRDLNLPPELLPAPPAAAQ